MLAYINGIGLIAPGLEGYNHSRATLSGKNDWKYYPLSKQSVDMLPPNERRRTTSLIKLALAAAQSGIDDAGIKSESLASVFASSYGDFEIVDKLCRDLCDEKKFISPTLFHNSVHNAPAGYWAITSSAHTPSSSISAADASFAAGLLESMVQVSTSYPDVLLVCYDYPPPSPLDSKCTITLPFGLALVLSRNSSTTTRACLHIEPDKCIHAVDKTTECQNRSLETLRRAAPAARGLTLLEGICRRQTKDIVLPYFSDNKLTIKLES
jgi:hypothetical protein